MPINELNGNHKHVTAQIRDFTTAVDARIDTKIAALSLATPATVDSKIAAHEAASDPHPSYMTDADVEAKIVDMLVAGTGIGLSYNSPAHHLTISQTGSIAPPGPAQSSLTYEFIAPDKVTLIPAASDWAANQISNLSMSTTNTFPVGVNTETKSIILTQAMGAEQATTGMQFTRSGGTHYAKHWRTLITGGVSVDSPILTVTVPQDLTMAYLDGKISPPFISGETVLANTFTVAAVPTGKRRYAFVTWNSLGFSGTVPTISAASIGGTSVTPTAGPFNSNSIQNYSYYALVEIPTGTSIPVTGTVSQAPGRSFVTIQVITCPLGSAVSVDSATGASNTALAVSSTAGAIPTGGLVLGVSSEYFSSGSSTAGHTETWTGGNTVDVVAFDTPTVAARIYFASISHGATAGSVTATTTPGTVTVNAHGIITAVLKAT